MNYLRTILTALCLSALLPLGGTRAEANTEQSQHVLDLIIKVNNYWQANNTPYVRAFWDHAAYHTGNMEAYRLTGRADWYAYSDKWCRHNEWMGAKSNDRPNWKYKTYGEGQDFVLFGDWQICFQTYIDMYNLVPAQYKVQRAIDVMSHECDMADTHFWWWADALYMVMPVMTKMYRLTGDIRYLDKLHQNFLWSDSLMYDPDEQLYYRDAKYIYPKVQTACNDGKSFWARGDGWVLAGLAKVLADMPQDYAGRDIFVQRFRELAEGVARVQRPDGYWSRSMLCEDDAPGPETSGTAFFCYGLLWGVNHGYLDAVTYKPVIDRAWHYLTETALQPDGSIGFVQPIGEKPDPTKTVDAHSQAPFGTGAWLLAACEMVRYLDGSVQPDADRVTNSIYHHTPNTPTVTVGGGFATAASAGTLLTAGRAGNTTSPAKQFTISNPTSELISQVVELTTMDVLRAEGIAVAREFFLLDADRNEIPYQITSDGSVLVLATVRPSAAIKLFLYKGQPADYVLTANGRIYPNRWDDLVWENDRSAWRLYGPDAHNHMHNPAYGFDTFVKNVPYPIQDQLYHNELTSYGVHERMNKAGRSNGWNEEHRSYTYHRNHGLGMDAYTVGPTLGAGAAALGPLPSSPSGEELLYPLYYQTARIIDNGPLRFTVEMTLPARPLSDLGSAASSSSQDSAASSSSQGSAASSSSQGPAASSSQALTAQDPAASSSFDSVVGGMSADSIREHRLITQDCGSHFARVEVTYEGLTRETPVCTGLTVHESDPTAYILNKKESYIAYAETLDHPESMNGQHFIAAFIPQGAKLKAEYRALPEKKAGAVGHALLTTTYRPGQPFVYYAGSAWSHYDVPTMAIWQDVIRHEAAIIQQGLQVE